MYTCMVCIPSRMNKRVSCVVCSVTVRSGAQISAPHRLVCSPQFHATVFGCVQFRSAPLPTQLNPLITLILKCYLCQRR